MADFLDEKRREIALRLKELGPLIDEYRRLEAAALALEGFAGAPPGERGAPPRAPGARRRGRPKGTGTRGTEALAIVRANPGITIPEIAQRIGIKQNYLYRVLPSLADDGLVRKQGHGWHPAEGS
jgi:Winged helix-turn-helix DNA-binding